MSLFLFKHITRVSERWDGRKDVVALCGKQLRRRKMDLAPRLVCGKCAMTVAGEADRLRGRNTYTWKITGIDVSVPDAQS